MRLASLVALLSVALAACGSPPSPSAAPAATSAAPATTGAKARILGDGLAQTITLEAKNGYPDPSSALAHVSELAIFDDQGAPLRALAARLTAQLGDIGKRRDDALRALDAELDEADRDEAKVRALVEDVGRLETEAARVTLDARLETRRILRPEQLVKLRALRSATAL